VPIACDACVLSFISGVNVGRWDFDTGGIISVDGGVSAAGIAGGSALLTGTFDSASVFDVGGGTFNFKIAGASFVDQKNEGLLAYLGLPSGNYVGGLKIHFSTSGTPAVGHALTSVQLFSGNVVNSPVPVRSAVWLFGSGLLGLAGIARRKKAA